MTGTQLKTTPKISVKIWRPIIDLLDKKLDEACLRRDAFLRRVLEVEVDRLDAEVAIPNSQASYDYVFSKLDAFDRKLVSLALPTALTARLNGVCQRKRIVRDAFFNRLFLLLAAPPKLIDGLMFPQEEDWRITVWSEYGHDGLAFNNAFYPLEPDIDPFWGIRTGLQHYESGEGLEDYVEPESGETVQVRRTFFGGITLPDTLYTKLFKTQLRDGQYDFCGMSCYLPDERVPGTATQKTKRSALDELIGQHEDLK